VLVQGAALGCCCVLSALWMGLVAAAGAVRAVCALWSGHMLVPLQGAAIKVLYILCALEFGC